MRPRTGQAERKRARQREGSANLRRDREIGAAKRGQTGDPFGEALEEGGLGTGEEEVGDESAELTQLSGPVGGGQSERVEESVGERGSASEWVFGEEGAGAVGASGAGRAVAVGAGEGVEGRAEGGVAGDVGEGGGSVVLVTVEPGEGGAEVEE